MKRILNSLVPLSAALTLLLAASGCCKKEEPVIDHFTHVAIYFGCGYNNLSEGIKQNVLKEMAQGKIPGKNEAKALLAFCHNTYEPYNYLDGNSPVLIRIYNDNGQAVIDTVKTYSMSTVSASASTLSSVLNDIKENYESDSYGMIFSSHASGWLPEGYKSPYDEGSKNIKPLSLGAQFHGSSSTITEIDVKDFADAIPFKLDYIILDCCLAGAAEVAWELSDVCDRIVFSPTEVLAGGYDYYNMAERIFSNPADLEGVCKDHFNKYSYATTTLVDCSGIEGLAESMASILSAHRQEFNNLKSVPTSSRTVQRYFYQFTSYMYFYDLRHLAVTIGATESELADLDAALKRSVLYENHSSMFLEGLRLTNVCGLSMYIPYNNWSTLNAYYKGLGWNNVVKVVDN